MSDKKVFSQDDLNADGKLRVAIDGNVYDVTDFVTEHPGGKEILTNASGKDSTKEFEDIGHSDEALDILKDKFVGEYKP